MIASQPRQQVNDFLPKAARGQDEFLPPGRPPTPDWRRQRAHLVKPGSGALSCFRGDFGPVLSWAAHLSLASVFLELFQLVKLEKLKLDLSARKLGKGEMQGREVREAIQYFLWI